MFTRSIDLPEPGAETFFLWGSRQTGKTTLLRDRYPEAMWLDLLETEEFRRYLVHPERLREEVAAAAAPFVVVDEAHAT